MTGSIDRFSRAGSSKLPARLFLIASVALLISSAAADSRRLLQTAADLAQQGRLDEAEKQARIALSDPTARAAAYSVLGTIRLQQKRMPESVSYLQKALQLEPHLVGARLSLAEAYIAEGKREAALGMYRRVLELDSSNVAARFGLARVESERGNYRQSLEIAKPILPELKKSPEGILVLAADYLKVGDTRAAEDLSRDWILLPEVPSDWAIKFALLLAKGGITDGAIEVLENAGKQNAASYELAFNLAGLYLLNNNPTLALKQYDLALNANPNSMPALRQAAIIAEQQGHLERSLSYWIRAKKLDPDDPDILLGFGRVCLKMDLLEDAEPALTKAASLRPDDPSFQYTLASAKVGKKQFAAAQTVLEKLVAKNPGDSQIQYALGSVLYLEGHLPDAALHLAESVRLQPQQVASHYYLALIARDQGHDAEAIERLQNLLKEYPDHAPSCEALGELLMRARQYSEAESNLEKAVRLNPNSVKANYQLGLLLSRMGKKEEADKQLELAKSIRAEDEKTSRLQLRLLDPDQ